MLRIVDKLVATHDMVMHVRVVTVHLGFHRGKAGVAEVEDIQVLRITQTVGGHHCTAVDTEAFRVSARAQQPLAVAIEMAFETFEELRPGIVEEMNAVRVEEEPGKPQRFFVRVVDVRGVITMTVERANSRLGFADFGEIVALENEDA